MEYQIIPYQPQYQQDLVLVWEQSIRATHHFLSEEDLIYFRSMVQKLDFSQFQMLCALAPDGSLAGFAAVAGCRLEMLFLSPDHMGKGLGKALLTICTQQGGVCQVEVNEQNQHAAAFYQHFGFKVVERKPQDTFGKPYPILRLQLDTGSSSEHQKPL